VYYPDEERTQIPWSRPPTRTHPVLAAVLAIAIGVGAWHGLVSYLRASRGRPTTAAGPIVIGADDPRAPGRTATNAPPRASAHAATDTAVGIAAGPAPPSRTDSLRTGPTRRDIVPAPSPAAARDSGPPEALIASARIHGGATSSAPAESAGPNLSPFLRSHPWAAVPGQRYYYPSSCPATLRLRDLVFFRTEEQARAQGFARSPSTDCQ